MAKCNHFRFQIKINILKIYPGVQPGLPTSKDHPRTINSWPEWGASMLATECDDDNFEMLLTVFTI